MLSKIARRSLPVGLAVLLAGMIVWAQDRPGAEPPGRDSTDVFNTVEGRTVVVTSVPEGMRVEKGDLICELDPSELRDRLATEEIVVRGAEADVVAARIAREVAVMAVIEYMQGSFPQELARTEGEIKLAEAKLASAEDNLDWSRRMFVKGYVSASEQTVSELALKQARFALEEAQSHKKVLIDYSKGRTIKALTGAVEAARANELAKQAVLERERSVQKRLRDQIGHCRVAAPAAGRITYTAPIGAGAIVHEGQLLGRVVSAGAPNTKAK